MLAKLKGRTFSSIKYKVMSSFSFVQQLNPISNKTEWKVVSDDYDYTQEIATSCYGDMLHDTERNRKFGEALKKAIDSFHKRGKEAHVLDIGTGTGLLSMLAARFGADSVVACEAFLPVAECAIDIIKENKYSDKIKVLKCHSTALTVGEKGDLKQKANILVSEVFDTELIGEGAISTFNHAFQQLLEEDCIVIPSLGTVYVQVVESDLALKWNKLEDWKVEKQFSIVIPETIKKCSGAAAVHDIQLSEFSLNNFKPLSDAVPVFKFEWAKNKKIPLNRQNYLSVKATDSGKAQVIFMWWDLTMDQDGDIIISCAPVWQHPDTKGSKQNVNELIKSLPWRDHWMQAVYFLPNETTVEKNSPFALISSHDEFSFWFQIQNSINEKIKIARPICDCTFHFMLSRTRIGAINDERRRTKFFHSLKNVINSETICILLNDISLLALLSARLGAKKVFTVSENSCAEKINKMLCEENNLTDRVSVVSSTKEAVNSVQEELNGKKHNILFLSEPYFRNSILPWDNLSFWYLKEEILNDIKSLKSIKSIKTYPEKCKIKCCAVQFDNLWKLASPLNTCEGFSMTIFDDLIHNAKMKSENYVEAQPLWEYPGRALTLPVTLFDLDFNKDIPKEKFKSNGELEIKCSGRCDGIAFWIDYDLTNDSCLSFGITNNVVVNEYISWDMFERQGVHLFREQPEVNLGDTVYFMAEFDPNEADFIFKFSLNKIV